MRENTYVRWACLALAMACGVMAARAQVVVPALDTYGDLVRNYNAVVLGNASVTQANTWAGIAVQGNLTLGAEQFGQRPDLYGPGSDPTVYVGGQLTITSDVHIKSGFVSAPNLTGTWSYDSVQRRLSGGGGNLYSINSDHAMAAFDPRGNPAPANWNWASLASQATSLSTELAALAASGTVGVSGGILTFTPDTANAGTVVFNLDASLLGTGAYQNLNGFQFNMGADQNFVVNVLNAENRNLFSNINFNSNAFGANGDESRLLWNITGSGNVNLASQGDDFRGSILAPLVNLSNNHQVTVSGQILAGNLTYADRQLHYEQFSPVSVLVPEPSTYALWTLALCGAGLWWQRRRSGRAAAKAE